MKLFLRLSTFALMLFSASVTAYAQPDEASELTPISDEAVSSKDAQQHADWKSGNGKFPGKPRDMWSVGLSGGYLQISGDVASSPGFGLGLYVRKSLGYLASIRLDAFGGVAYGQNYKLSSGTAVTTNPALRGLGYNSSFYYNYKNQMYQGSVDLLFNVSNILFHKPKNRVSFYAGPGAGFMTYRTWYDAKDASGNIYEPNYTRIRNFNNPGFDAGSVSARDGVLSDLRNLQDGTYETPAETNESYNFKLGDNTLNFFFSVALGFDFKLTKRLSLGIEHKAMISINDDLLDGKKWSEQGAATGQADIIHFTNIRIGYHLGNKKKNIEPLWFVNPLDASMGDISQSKKDIDDLEGYVKNDADGDGVPDKLDKEPNTPADCDVDARGVKKDSDKDGLADCEDKEPFSPPGYPTNAQGIAQTPKYATEQDMQKIVDSKLTPLRSDVDNLMKKGGSLDDWFLPMVHFDVDKYGIRPDAYENLHHIGTIMQKYPEVKVVAKGNADVRNTNQYNELLSWERANECIEFLVKNYGIARERLILQHYGEVKNIVPNASNEPAHKANRRVEFYVATPNDKEMPRPTGKEAGSRK